MPTSFIKDANEVLDYVVDWSLWLDEDTIQTSTWTVASGLTKDSDTNTTTTATVWLSGGTTGTSYLVTNRVVTAGGRTSDRSFTISVKER